MTQMQIFAKTIFLCSLAPYGNKIFKNGIPAQSLSYYLHEEIIFFEFFYENTQFWTNIISSHCYIANFQNFSHRNFVFLNRLIGLEHIDWDEIVLFKNLSHGRFSTNPVKNNLHGYYTDIGTKKWNLEELVFTTSKIIILRVWQLIIREFWYNLIRIIRISMS